MEIPLQRLVLQVVHFKGYSDKKDNYWHLPASWKAIIKNGKIYLWQVYADAKIPYDIINKNKKQ